MFVRFVPIAVSWYRNRIQRTPIPRPFPIPYTLTGIRKRKKCRMTRLQHQIMTSSLVTPMR